MKAKIKLLIILIAIFALSLIAGIFAGCSIGELSAQDLANSKGLNCPVTYYANGGLIGNKCYSTIYFKAGSPIFPISDSAQSGEQPKIAQEGYIFDGWVYCELDANGNPILSDENGAPLNVLPNGTADIKDSNGTQFAETNKKFYAKAGTQKAFENGNLVINQGEHIYLAATWIKDVVLEYKLVTDTPIQTEEVDGEGDPITYNTGATIAEESFGRFNTKQLNKVDTEPAKFKTHSYIHLYFDIDCTQPVIGNSTVINKPEDGKNYVIYAKYLQGEWHTVRTASNFSSMISNSAASNYYIPFDIDCSGQEFSLIMSTFNHRVEGNGFTVSNITVGAIRAQQIFQNGNVSLFGNLGDKAQINNLTIKNVNVKLSVRANFTVTVNALFSGYNQGAILNNFSVEGYNLEISLGGDGADKALINNIQRDNTGNYQTDKWLYGTDTDAEFVSVYGEVVKNATLKIDNEQVTGGQQ